MPNSVTVAGVESTILCLSPGNTVGLEVFASPAGNLPLPADTRFSIDGTGASPASGNFDVAFWFSITFSGAATNYYVKAGIDMNANGTLDATEITHKFAVRVIDFQGATVGSQRVGGGPVEPGLTSVKAAEHFEVGGNFKFELMGGIAGGSLLRWELYEDVAYMYIVPIASGQGNSFTYTFGASSNFVRVKYYADKNNNFSQDTNEPYLVSPIFKVLQPRVFNITADVSTAITAITDPAFPSRLAGPRPTPTIFELAQNLLLRKDSEDDWRAAVRFNVTTTPFTATLPGGIRPDPVVNQQAERDKHYNVPADLVFVKQLYPETLWGVTSSNYTWHEIIINYQIHLDLVTGTLREDLMAGTIAHEMGHGVGIGLNDPNQGHPVPDDDTNNHRVMTSTVTGTYNHLTRDEARAYDAGPLSLAELPAIDAGVPALTEGQLDTVFAGARSRLVGLNKSAFALNKIELAIVDLPGSLLGLTSEGTIWIDQNAAGHDWFIDATPRDDSEFRLPLGHHELQALPRSPAFGKADLLTVLFHEMGHAMGLEHGDDHEVMAPTLPLGIRRLPETEVIHSEELAGENSGSSPLLAGQTNSARQSAADAIAAAIVQTPWDSPGLDSTVWQPTLLNETTSMLVLPKNVRDLAFEEVWRRYPYLDRSKGHDPMDDLFCTWGLLAIPEDDPWNA